MKSDALMNVARDECEEGTAGHAHALAFVYFTHVRLDAVDAAK